MDKPSNDSLAQLGERYLDRVEVAGSNPVGIIRLKKLQLLGNLGAEAFLFYWIHSFFMKTYKDNVKRHICYFYNKSSDSIGRPVVFGSKT